MRDATGVRARGTAGASEGKQGSTACAAATAAASPPPAPLQVTSQGGLMGILLEDSRE